MASSTFENAVRTDAYQMYPEDIVLITDPDHPLFDPRVNWPVDESMVADIMLGGVEEPIIVTKEGNKAIVIDGRQRIKAAREANLRLVKQGKERIRVKLVKRNGSADELYGVSISTNEHRKNDDITLRAEKCHKFITMGRTLPEAAIRFGVSTETVKNWEKLVSLSVNVKKAVDAGEISTTAAIQFAGMDLAGQNAALKETLAADKPTVVAAKKAAKKITPESAGPKMRSKKDIEAKYKTVRQEWIANKDDDANSACLNLLKWVLNIEDRE